MPRYGRISGAVIAPSDRSNVEAFRVLAEGYCAFIESSGSLKRGEFVWQLAEHFVALYDAGMKLPFAMADDETHTLESITNDEWQALYERLGAKLGEVNDYSFMFDPYDLTATPVIGSLSDDAADVYRDLKDGLVVLAEGGALEDAVWEWHFGFDNHWGRHAAHALYALHSLTHPGSVKSVKRTD
jgi:hypothetical protein